MLIDLQIKVFLMLETSHRRSLVNRHVTKGIKLKLVPCETCAGKVNALKADAIHVYELNHFKSTPYSKRLTKSVLEKAPF